MLILPFACYNSLEALHVLLVLILEYLISVIGSVEIGVM